MSPSLTGALLSLAAYGVYATHDVFVKTLGAHYAAFQIVFFVGLMSFPLITLILMRDKTDGTLIPKHPRWAILRGLSSVVSSAAGFYAFSQLPMAQTYAILFATPMLITLLSIPLLGEVVGWRRGVAVAVGMIGVLIVLRPGSAPLSLGHVAALLAACASALSGIIVRKIGAKERSAVLMLYPMMMQVAFMGMMMPWVYRPMALAHLGMVALIAVLSVVGGLLLIAAYRAAVATVVAPMQYSQLIWAAFYGWLLFSESIDLWTALGAGVIVLSGLYIVLRESHAKVSQNQPVTQNGGRLDAGPIVKPSKSALRKPWRRRGKG